MSNEEKILLIKLLLEDIRGNWGWKNWSYKVHRRYDRFLFSIWRMYI